MIDRLLHQIWVGPYRMPVREQAFVDRMRRTNPGWQHVLWNNNNLPPLTGHAKQQFDWRMSLGDYAFAADILRIALLHDFGGVYVDVDTEPKATLSGFLPQCAAMFRHHGPDDLTLSNDFIAFRRGHPLAKFLLSTMAQPAYCFDPSWLGREVRAWMGMPITANHADTKSALQVHNIAYIPSTVWARSFTNHALYSWSPENRERFAKGDYK